MFEVKALKHARDLQASEARLRQDAHAILRDARGGGVVAAVQAGHELLDAERAHYRRCAASATLTSALPHFYHDQLRRLGPDLEGNC